MKREKTGVGRRAHVAVGVGVAVLLCSCADAEPDAPPSELTPSEGVFGIVKPGACEPAGTGHTTLRQHLLIRRTGPHPEEVPQ